MYCVGDRVSYPMHGAGTIVAIEEREIQGEKHSYYVLKFALGGMKVMVPVKSIEEVGLRNVISSQEYEKVMERLAEREDTVSDNWNRRYRENLDKMRTGSIYDVADVVRSLTIRDRKKGLSTGEKKMLNNAKQILLSEMVLASSKDQETIERRMEEVIRAE